MRMEEREERGEGEERDKGDEKKMGSWGERKRKKERMFVIKAELEV